MSLIDGRDHCADLNGIDFHLIVCRIAVALVCNCFCRCFSEWSSPLTLYIREVSPRPSHVFDGLKNWIVTISCNLNCWCKVVAWSIFVNAIEVTVKNRRRGLKRKELNFPTFVLLQFITVLPQKSKNRAMDTIAASSPTPLSAGYLSTGVAGVSATASHSHQHHHHHHHRWPDFASFMNYPPPPPHSGFATYSGSAPAGAAVSVSVSAGGMMVPADAYHSYQHHHHLQHTHQVINGISMRLRGAYNLHLPPHFSFLSVVILLSKKRLQWTVCFR